MNNRIPKFQIEKYVEPTEKELIRKFAGFAKCNDKIQDISCEQRAVLEERVAIMKYEAFLSNSEAEKETWEHVLNTIH